MTSTTKGSALDPGRHHTHMKRVLAVAAAIAASLTFTASARAASDSSSDRPEAKTESVTATFEGQAFEMVDGWGQPNRFPEVGACHVAGDEVTCYRSERAMDRALASTASPSQARASCSSSLRLYDGTYKSGPVLYLTTRWTTLNLSSYGFNNRTSSYRVGACSARFYNGFGSGLYPGNTSAWASANWMLSGWNNTISSVFIN